jgi:hypothetical protein
MSAPVRRQRAATPRLESLEDRRLLSGPTLTPAGLPSLPAGLPPALLNRIPSGVRIDPAALSAIRDALLGSGPGAEFAALLRRQVGNIGGIINGFATGRRAEFTTPGVVIKIPRWQEQYQGPHYDHLTATAAGALWLRSGQLQLGAILRGPFDEAEPAYVVFGIDRGGGAVRGPLFGNRPALAPDLLVTLRIGPGGAPASGEVLDLTDGSTRTIDPARIQVQGATIRALLDRDQLPPRGLAPARYRFSAWTSRDPAAGIAQVGSFLPESRMIRVGVEPRARLPWLQRP